MKPKMHLYKVEIAGFDDNERVRISTYLTTVLKSMCKVKSSKFFIEEILYVTPAKRLLNSYGGVYIDGKNLKVDDIARATNQIFNNLRLPGNTVLRINQIDDVERSAKCVYNKWLRDL